MPVGPNANVNVKVTAQPQQAAQQTQKAFEQALANALKSKAVQSAIAGIVKSFNTGGQQMGQGFNKAFGNIAKQGQQVASQLQQAFTKVGQAAQRALSAQNARGASPELQTLSNHIVAVTQDMQRLANASRQTFLVVEEAGRSVRAAVRSADQAARDATSRQTQSERLQIAQMQQVTTQIRAQGEVRRASISAFGQITLQVMRSTERAISATFRGGTRIVQTFARAAGSVFRGLQRSASSAFQGIQRAAASAFRSMGALIRGFGRGLAGALSGMSRAFQSAFRRDEQALNSSLRRREQAMRNSAQRGASLFSAGPLGLLAGGAGVGGLLTSGFERFGLQERLQQQFTALLGGDAQKAGQVLQQLSEYARTTAFDFGEVALGVAQMTAAFEGNVERGIQINEFLADVTSLTGGTTAQLSAARLAFSQIAAAGRLEGQELNQLLESLPGAPIVRILADKFFGGDTAAFQDARRNGELGGKITSEGFFSAFQEGMQQRFPEIDGFAQKAASTVTGRLANLKESFALFGSTLIGLVDGPIKSFFGALTDGFSVVGAFITGEMFRTGAGTGAQNPWEDLANMAPDARVPFEDLTPEMQEFQRNEHGWEEGKGFFLAAAHAAGLWNQLHREAGGTDNLFGLSDENLEQLAKLRELLGDFAKGVAIVASLAGAFKLLGLAFGLLTSPLTLMLTLAGGFAAFFGQIYRASEPLRDSISRLNDAFGPLLESLRGFGGVVLDKFFGLFGPDNQAGMERIGEIFAGFVDNITRGAEKLTSWINWAALMTASGDFGAVLSDVNTRIANFLGGLLDITPEEIEAEGGGIAGLLRNTFLEPVVNFFTVTLPENIGTITSAIGGFFSDIWGAITGESGGGRSEGGRAVFSGPGRVTSGGDQGMLSFLTETFLNPIVTFFTDTLPSGVRSAVRGIGNLWGEAMNALFGRPSESELTGSVISTAGGVGTAGGTYGFLTPLVDSITNFKNNVETFGVGEAFASIWDGVVESAGNIWASLQVKLDELWENIVSWFQDLDWGEAITGAAIAGAIGLAFGGVPGLLVGVLAGFAATNINLFQPIVDVITNAWSSQIFPALTDLWGRITGWFANIFTYDNLVGAGLDILAMMNDIGEAIGSFFGSDEFQIAVGAAAGIAAGITALIASFTTGLAVGLSGAFLDWAEMFGQFLNDAWSNIDGYLIFLPDPIINAISLALGSETSGAITLIAAAVIGPAIVKGIIAGVTGFAPALIQGAGGLAAMFFGGKSASSVMAGIGKDPKLRSAGAGIAASVVAGILSFELGQAAGRRGDTGSLVLSLLTGTFTGASIGLAAGGPLAAAVTGTLSGLFAGLGYVLGKQGEDAAQAAAEFDRYADAIKGVNDEAQNAALAAILIEEVLEAGAGADRFLEQARFNARDFVDEVIEGGNNVEAALSQMFFDLAANENQNLIPPEWTGQLSTLSNAIALIDQEGGPVRSLEDLRDELDALEEGGLISEGELEKSLELLDLLADAGVDLDEVIKLLDQEQVEIISAASANRQRENLATIAATIGSVGEAVKEMGAVLGEDLNMGDTLSQLRTLLEGSTLSADEKVEAIGEAAEIAKGQLNEAYDALVSFLTGTVEAPTVLEFRARGVLAVDQFKKDIESQAQQATSETDPIEADVQWSLNVESVSEFSNTVAQMVRDGLQSGEIRATEADVDAFITQLFTDALNTPGLTTEGQQALQEALDAMTGADISSFLSDISLAQQDVDAVKTLGTEIQDQLVQGIADPSTVQAGLLNPSIAAMLNPESMRPAIEPQAKAARAIFDEQFARGGLTSAELTAAVITGAGGTSDVGDSTGGIGSSLVEAIIGEIDASQGDLETAGANIATSFASGVRSGMRPLPAIGALGGASLVAGFRTATGAAASAARGIAFAMVLGLSGVVSGMYNIGVNAGQSFARGVRSAVGAAAAAAAAIAAAAMNAARRSLKISSPSLVFTNIGRDVGRGFIQGIKDTEGDIATALSDALSNAVEKGVRAMKGAVERASAAGSIFELLAPSLLPGGTTNAARLSDTLNLRESIFGFRGGLQEAASGALGGTGRSALLSAYNTVTNLPRATAQFVIDQRAAFNEARQAQNAIKEYNADLRQLNADFKSGALGQRLYNERVRELKEQLATGRTSAESYRDELKLLGNELRLGVLNREAREQALSELGERPEGLTYAQQQILRSGATTLDARFAAGLENREQIMEALDSIRQWGQEALASGQSLNTVIPQIQKYRDSLAAQLRSYGFNTAAINSLISTMGLSNAALQKMRNELTSLNQTTVAGAENAANFLEQFLSIREFGQRMLEAGVGVDAVTKQIREFRNQIINQAVAFGFDRAQVEKLAEVMGLSNAQLQNFVAQLNNFNTEAKNAEAIAKAAAEEARKREEEEKRKQAEQGRIVGTEAIPRARINELHVHVPTGDPEAVALVVGNRLSYERVASW